MNNKNIKKSLQSKIKKWIESIEDETVQRLVKRNTMVSGGAIASMKMKEEVNDYDIYFRTKDAAIAVADYYCKQYNKKMKAKDNTKRAYRVSIENEKDYVANDNIDIDDEDFLSSRYCQFHKFFGRNNLKRYQDGRIMLFVQDKDGQLEDETSNGFTEDQETPEVFEDVNEQLEEQTDDKYEVRYISNNAITLSNNIQLIIRFYGEPDEIHKNYDFEHAKGIYTNWDNKLTIGEATLNSLIDRELKYSGSLYPVCSVMRTRKFIERGWTIDAGQYLKMIIQCQELDLLNPDVLQDQLVGVDSAYFQNIIDAIVGKDVNREHGLKTNELIETINRFF